MAGHVVGEDLDGGMDQADHAVGMPAGPAAQDGVRQVEHLPLATAASAERPTSQSLHGVGQPGEARYAGAALTRRLAGQVPDDAGGFDQCTSVVGEHGDQTASG